MGTLEWMNDIEFAINTENSDRQKAEIASWCRFIGNKRYKQLYIFVKKSYKDLKIPYDALHSCAKYDFKLSDVLYSSVKFVEHYMRAILVNQFGETKLTNKNYLYEISKVIGNEDKQLNCETFYEKRLAKNCTFEEFLNESGFDTLIKCFVTLSTTRLKEFLPEDYNINFLEKNLYAIKTVRNEISHCGVIIDGFESVDKDGKTLFCTINGNKDSSLKANIMNIFSLIPSKEVLERRCDIVNEIKKQYFNNLPDISTIAVTITKEEKEKLIRGKRC